MNNKKALSHISAKLRQAVRKQAHPLWGVSRSDFGVFIERQDEETAERTDEHPDPETIEVNANFLTDWWANRKREKVFKEMRNPKKDPLLGAQPAATPPPAAPTPAHATPAAPPSGPTAPSGPAVPAATAPQARPFNSTVERMKYDHVLEYIKKYPQYFAGGVSTKVLSTAYHGMPPVKYAGKDYPWTAKDFSAIIGRMMENSVLGKEAPVNGKHQIKNLDGVDMSQHKDTSAMPEAIPTTGTLPADPPKKGPETDKFVAMARNMIPQAVDIEKIVLDYLDGMGITDFGERPGDGPMMTQLKAYAQDAVRRNTETLTRLVAEMENLDSMWGSGPSGRKRLKYSELISWLLGLRLRDESMKLMAQSLARLRGRAIEKDQKKQENKQKQQPGVGGPVLRTPSEPKVPQGQPGVGGDDDDGMEAEANVKTAAKGDYDILKRLLVSYMSHGVDITDANAVTSILATNAFHSKVVPLYTKLMADPGLAEDLNADVAAAAWARKKRIDELELEDNGAPSQPMSQAVQL
jgi:hypothetical protein